MKTDLEELYRRWRHWSASTIGADDGQPFDFPEWADLIRAAAEAMHQSPLTEERLRTIAACWAISEEAEELLDHATEHIDACWPTVEALARSSLPACRWQVYQTAGTAGPRAERLLRAGMKDPDPYARRRAILALARLQPRDAQELAEGLLEEADPYLRQAAIAMISAASPEFAMRACEVLTRDESDHVRAAAREALNRIAQGGNAGEREPKGR